MLARPRHANRFFFLFGLGVPTKKGLINEENRLFRALTSFQKGVHLELLMPIRVDGGPGQPFLTRKKKYPCAEPDLFFCERAHAP
jgi:hypothetical protein